MSGTLPGKKLEQIRTIDRSRLTTYIGSPDDDIMDYIDNAIGISVGSERGLASSSPQEGQDQENRKKEHQEVFEASIANDDTDRRTQ